MDAELHWLLIHGSYALMLAALIVSGLGVPVPEDIVLLASGVLIHRGVTSWEITAGVIYIGVLGGDLIIFLTARRLGPAALKKKFFARLLPEKRRTRLEGLFQRYGGAIVFIARNLAGIRTPVFALAGVHQMRVRSFILWDSLGLCISGPLVVTLGYFFSHHLELALRGLAEMRHFVLLGAGVALVVYALYTVGRWYIGGLRRKRDS